MKPQNIAITLALLAVGASFSVTAERPVFSEPPAAVAEPDFTALRQQASDALAALRQSQENRLASAVNPAL